MENNSVLFAFLLTLFAGLSTGFGSLFALFSKRINTSFLSGALGFSAGVMIYISMIDIFPKALESLSIVYYEKHAYLLTTLFFFLGIFLIGIIDKLVPSFENPHEIRSVSNLEEKRKNIENTKLMRMGLFSALAIAIHNFPEGLATFIAALHNPTIGLSIAFAIAIHNIPEGIAVFVPIYYATGSRKKAFIFSFLSGLAEPLGALIGYFILFKFIDDAFFGMVFAIVAGIMVYISLDELLPTAEKYGKHHIAIYGLISGMLVMALSLIVFI